MSALTEAKRTESLKLLAELKEVVRRLEIELGLEPTPAVFTASEHSHCPPPRHPADLARYIYKARRYRDRYFASDLFAEPAWDILLDLFHAHRADRQVCVSSACIAAAVPQTTGLRWLENLEERGLIARSPDRRDGRRVYISLTSEAVERLSRYLSEIDSG